MLICRTCLSAENLSSIFENFTSTQIISATGTTIQENDGLPQMICKSCKDLLSSALQLRERSLYAERVLLEELNSSIKQEHLHRDESTDSENDISILRQTKLFKTRKIKIETKGNLCQTKNATSAERNECHTKNAEFSQGKPLKSSIFIKDIDESLKIDIKIENVSESNDFPDPTPNTDPYDEFLREIAKIPKTNSNSTNATEEEELKRMYHIIDQELERSKTKYKAKINLSEVLNEDNVLDLLSPDLKSLLSDNCTDKSQEHISKSQRLYTKQNHNKAKLAKLWSLAVKPIDRNKLVQCSVCPKLFKYNYFLRHANTHLDREFTCEVCGSKFVNVYAMRYHQQRRHGAARKHACAHCDYTAVHKDELLNHTNRVHTGQRPFICDACGAGFCQRRTLVQHMRKHYGVKRHRCEFCNKLYKSLSQLGAHRKQYHLLRYTYLCYECPYKSTDRQTVRRHLQRIHGIARLDQRPIQLIKEKR